MPAQKCMLYRDLSASTQRGGMDWLPTARKSARSTSTSMLLVGHKANVRHSSK